MGSTESVCRVWSNDPDEWERDTTEMPELYLGDPLDQPTGTVSLSEWWQDGEGGIHWGGESDLPEIEEGGWHRVTMGYTGDDEGLDHVWISSLEPLTDDEVHQVRVEWEAYETRRQEARLLNGCAFYDVTRDGQGRCAIGGAATPQRHPCSRKKGQTCLTHYWKPLETATWRQPTNHFLDGTGVCKWANAPYNPGFEGHQFEPTPEQLFGRLPGSIPKHGRPSLAEFRRLWEEARDEAIVKGEFSFSLTVAGHYYSFSTKLRCDRCSGLPLYPEDCDRYEERPLERDEIILPCTWCRGCRRHNWRFAVHKLDAPEPSFREVGYPVWSQWYTNSNSEGDTEMWTVCGIPVTGMGWSGDEQGQPHVKGALQFADRDFRKAKRVLDRLANEWRELHKVAGTVGEIILGEPGVMQPKTIEAVLKTLWRGLSNRACAEWLRRTIRDDRWGQAWSMFPWEMDEEGRGWPDQYNWSAIVRRTFKKWIQALLTGWYPGRHQKPGRFGPRLFPARVVDPWLRWAYGLVGAPKDLGLAGWRWSRDHRPECRAPHKDDPAFVLAAGRTLTTEAEERLRSSWRARHDKKGK